MGLVFLASLIALKYSDIDITLGMDGLAKHQAMLDCATKYVQITHPSCQIVYFASRGSESQLYMLNEHPIPNLEDISIVCDIPDIFREELSGIPPDMCVEFVVQIIPGTAPIYRRPYKMAQKS